MRLLAVSKAADETGDNRISRDVELSVVGAACVTSVGSVARLMRASIDGSASDWLGLKGRSLVAEAAGAALPQISATQHDLRAIWAMAIGSLAWQDEHDRGKLSVIRGQILDSAAARGFPNLEPELRRVGPLEATFRFSTNRGSSVETDRAAPPKTIEEAEDLFRSDREARPGLLLPLVHELRATAAPDPAKITRLLRLLTGRNERYGWTYTGAYSVYQELLPLLSDVQRWSLVGTWVGTRDYAERDLWLDQARDLDALCRDVAKLGGGVPVRRGTTRLIRMHELWSDGAGHVPRAPLPRIPSADDGDLPQTWAELAVETLAPALEAGGTLDVSTAARGLYALLASHVDLSSKLTSMASSMTDRAQVVVLLILERLASSHPTHVAAAAGWISSKLHGDVLPVRLQAWVVTETLGRTQGTGPVPLPARPLPQEQPVAGGGGTGLLQYDDRGGGRFNFGTTTQHIRALLARVASATDDDAAELERAVASSLSQKLADQARGKRPTRYWDIQIRDDPQMAGAFAALERHYSAGRWSDIPAVVLAQAILTGDDPWVLLRTPDRVAPTSDWPTDDALDAALRVGREEFKRACRRLVHIQLGEDEVVVAAVLSTYSRKIDVEFDLAFEVVGRLIAPGARVGSTFGGRSFSWYERDRHVPGSAAWVTLRHGGLMQFPDESFVTVPSRMWTEVFGWAPDPRDPTTWRDGTGGTVRYERVVGPFRSPVQEPLSRQPLVQRWVCSRAVWEAAERASGFTFIERTDLAIEAPHYLSDA